MSYLLFQMALYMLVTLLLGFLLGWYIWGNLLEEGNLLGKLGFGSGGADAGAGQTAAPVMSGGGDSASLTKLRAENAKLQSDVERISSHRAKVEKDLDACIAKRLKLEEEIKTLRDRPAAPAKVASAPAPAAKQSKPTGLNAPRNNKADDLKEIKGIGPALETMLQGMGVYHFDQITTWGPSELAWVDENLEGFKGRASRDEWVAQAKKILSS